MSPIGIVLVLLMAFFPPLRGRLVTLDNNSHCISEGIPAGTPVDFSYQVVQGDFRDVEVLVRKPDLSDLYRVKQKPAGNFSFVAPEHGHYTFCFRTPDPSFHKKIEYTIDIGETPTDDDPVQGPDPNFPCPSISRKADSLIREVLSTVQLLQASVNQTLQRFEEKISRLEDSIQQ